MTTKVTEFKNYLLTEEKAESTIEKYICDVTMFLQWMNGRELSKNEVLEYKTMLIKNYKPKSVNSKLSSLNSFLDWLGQPDCKVKNIKIQQTAYTEPNRDLTKDEYVQLLKTAYKQGKLRLYYIMQTICATGIRVSELKYITADAIKSGIAYVKCKGKTRAVFIPEKLTELLTVYIKKEHRSSGAVFVTRNGNPIDRSNIWAEMKKLCEKAGVMASKVFPHNLRHLFGKVFYEMYQDVVRLADILGHSSVNTTRIYTSESGCIHRSRIQKMGLVFSPITTKLRHNIDTVVKL